MLTGVIQLLILVNYGGVCGAAAARAPKLPKYGCVKLLKRIDLGKYVLDSLYKCCSEYDSPEIKRAVLDKVLPGIAVEDKVRYVVLTLLEQAAQSEQFKLLLAKLGYAGQELLCKLLSDSSIASLVEMPEATDDNETRRRFRLVAGHCQGAPKAIIRCLEQMLIEEDKKGLLELAENGWGQDLAFHTLKAMDNLEEVTPSSAFTALVDSWSGDTEKRDRLLPVVNEFSQILLRLRARDVAGQLELRELIVRRVYVTCDTERECFELLRGFLNHQTLGIEVKNYITKELKRHPTLSFVRKYLVYTQKNVARWRLCAYTFFRGLWPSFAEFRAADIEWKSDPVWFNMISLGWLQGMLKDLCDSPPEDPDVVELLDGCMNIMDYDVFISILIPLPRETRDKLALFMLKHQKDAKVIEKYRRCLECDSRRKNQDRRLRGVFNLLDNYFST
ncbi:hypothetical protein PAPHI01_0673 [Pancytospora philotis]|nr:hypothetical protein PAPHI01_0673 [Pancytospora philotis]